MAEYINREALLESLKNTEKKLHELYDTAETQDMAKSCYGQWIMLAECILRIKEQPKADVAPVRRGHWIDCEDDYSSYVRCSECGDEYTNWEADCAKTKFCPGCGAWMGGTQPQREDI